MTSIEIPAPARVIDMTCTNCGGTWHEHSSGGHCPLQRLYEPFELTYWHPHPIWESSNPGGLEISNASITSDRRDA